MIERIITDWDDAYANAPNIPGSDRWPGAWERSARTFREHMAEKGRASFDIAYGDQPRNRLDLFLPEASPRGLVVFVHGGFWRAFDKSYWSHLAAGSLAHGYAVAMPSYTLCPEIRIAGIVREVAAAIGKAGELVEGPVMLTGHSAGGHLVTRMVCQASPLSEPLRGRMVRVVSIAGVHDLRPLMRTAMNEQLRLDEEEAVGESPALVRPMEEARLVCWVGGAERAEFLRQSALLANIWTGLGAATASVVEPDRHHFNVIDGLADPGHALTCTLCAE